MRTPLVSVVITNFNGAAYLKDCLTTLFDTSYKNKELIFVDNGSVDKSIELARKYYPSVRIIRNKKNLGFVGANNQGFREARGKYVFLLNNDTKIEKGLFEPLVEFLEKNTSVGAVQPRVVRMDKPKILDSVGSFFTRTGFLYHYGFGKKDTKKLRKPIKLFSAKGCALMLRRDLVDRIGLFDPGYFAYFEETDLCWRIWMVGGSIYYLPEVYIKHLGWGTTAKMNFPFILFHSYKNRITTLIKNLGPKNLLVTLPVHLVLCLAAAGGYLLFGKPRNAFAVIRALGWSVANFGKTLRKRRGVQRMRKVDDRFLKELTRRVSSKYFVFLLTGLEKYTED